MSDEPHKGHEPSPRNVTRSLVLYALLCIVFVGCALTREISKTPRSSIEQLLLSQAIRRALHDLHLPLTVGTSIFVRVSGFIPASLLAKHDQKVDSLFVPPSDLGYVREAVERRLGGLGFQIKARQDEAAYRIKVLV